MTGKSRLNSFRSSDIELKEKVGYDMSNFRKLTNEAIIVTPEEETLSMAGTGSRNYCISIDCGRVLIRYL